MLEADFTERPLLAQAVHQSAGRNIARRPNRGDSWSSGPVLLSEEPDRSVRKLAGRGSNDEPRARPRVLMRSTVPFGDLIGE